jgi:hypothetical protein
MNIPILIFLVIKIVIDIAFLAGMLQERSAKAFDLKPETKVITNTVTSTEHIVKYVPPSKDEVVNEIIDQAREHGVSVITALEIAKCESRYDAFAVGVNKSGSEDVGVFQINDIHDIPKEKRFDYKFNIEWSIKKMSKEGFGAWYSSEHCWK